MELGPILSDFRAGGTINLKLGNNNLTHGTLLNIVNSFTLSPAVLLLDLSGNNITMVPPYVALLRADVCIVASC